MTPVVGVKLIKSTHALDFKDFFMKNFSRFRQILFALFVCLAFSSCQKVSDSSPCCIYGTWTSSYGDSYTISSSIISYNDGGFGCEWTASVEEVSGTSEGYIYIKYTSVGTGLSSNQNGKYHAVYFKDLTSLGCSLAVAYKSNSDSGVCASLDDVKNSVTVAGGYFGYHGEYAKSN